MQDEIVHHFARLRIECAEGLVHQQNFGAPHQRAGDGDALLHAARQLIGPGIGGGSQPHQAEQRIGTAGRGLNVGLAEVLAAVFKAAAELDVVHYREPGIQAVMLEHHGAVGPGAHDGLAVDPDVTGGVVLQPADDPQQGRLAAAGSPDKGDEFVVGDVETDVLQRLDAMSAFAEHLADLLDGNFLHGHDLRWSQGKALRCARRNS